MYGVFTHYKCIKHFNIIIIFFKNDKIHNTIHNNNDDSVI